VTSKPKKTVSDFIEDYTKRMNEIADALWGYAELGLKE